MADYIYLLQHRLTPGQRRALEAVRDAARGRGAPVFLVGGAVRDLTSGAPVRDLDFAIQGDVETLLDALRGAGARETGADKTFLSRYFAFPGGVRVEVGPTLTVRFPKPGVPEVHPAPILDDLRRRDFTANAMAISLNEGSYGLLLDPLNGVADLENRELRLVTNLGFIEQPALLLRAARLGNRLGWNMEERTARRYENAKEEGAIERLPAEARGYELEEIFHEEDPVSALEHLGAENWLESLSPLLGSLKVDQEGLDRVRDTLGQMEGMGIFVDPSVVYFPFLTGKLPPSQVAEIKAAFARPGFAEAIESLETRGRELASQLTSKAAALPSATWKLLFSAEPEVVLSVASSSRTGAVQTKFKAFFTEWPQARQRVPYALMQEMRITPDLPGYDALLEDLFFASMDGKLTTAEETRAFLEPFSPPAPAQQATPRRKAAKSARGRGRSAAAAVAVEDIEIADSGASDPDKEDDDDDALLGESGTDAESTEISANRETSARGVTETESVDSGEDDSGDDDTSGRDGDSGIAVDPVESISSGSSEAGGTPAETTPVRQGKTPAKKADRRTGPAPATPKVEPVSASLPVAATAKQPVVKEPAAKELAAKEPAKAAAKTQLGAAAKTVGAKSASNAAKAPEKVVVAARKASAAAEPVKPAAKAPEAAKKGASAKTATVESSAVKNAGVKNVGIKAVAAKNVPAKNVPGKNVPAKSTPTKNIPVKSVPAKAIPAKTPALVRAAATKAAAIDQRSKPGKTTAAPVAKTPAKGTKSAPVAGKVPAKSSKPVPTKRSSK